MSRCPALRILIAEAVADYIELPEDLHSRVLRSADPQEGIRGLLASDHSPHTALLLVLPPSLVRPAVGVLEGFSAESVAYRIVVVRGNADADEADYRIPAVFDLRTAPVAAEEFRFAVRRAEEAIAAEIEGADLSTPQRAALLDTWEDQDALITIGRALSMEHNPDTLLRTILSLSKKITGADAGSIFLVEDDGEGGQRLRFKYSHTFSKPLRYEEFTMPMDSSSIAGYVAVNGKVLNIADAYRIDPGAPYSFNPSFDREHGYRTRSMLVLPMRGNTDEVIGVIQLINSKEGEQRRDSNAAYEVTLATEEDFDTLVYPFKRRYERLMEAVAGQAAIAIENNRMLRQIEHQFEAFVKASVMAVESRDPATFGHSFRVAEMSTNTADAIHRSTEGPWQDESFSALRRKALEFAGLLHDFGKVYIEPSIFQKEKKLFHKDFENLRLRLHLIRRTIEGHWLREQGDHQGILEELERILSTIHELNEPTTEESNPDQRLREIYAVQREVLCVDPEGRWIPILTGEDAENLRVSKGSLNPRERAEIENHVVYTYNFVRRIPWPAEFAAIPEITYSHHEKLDGSGYPRGLCGRDTIPLEARIMAVADIFDALCAADRPYKRSLSRKRVFEILRQEALEGKLDRDVVDVFIESRAWDVPADLHRQSIPGSHYEKEPGKEAGL